MPGRGRGRKPGLKHRPGAKVNVQIWMSKDIHDRLWSQVYDTTGFIEDAIKEKLDREYIQRWAKQQELLLRAGL